jgi:hypothetical protein
MADFKFPDEIESKSEQENGVSSNVETELETEIEIVDDTPEEDRNRAPMKEPPADVTDEELEQYNDSVKRRLQHFSKGYHEERRAKEAAFREREEALKLAQSLAEENKRLHGTLGQGQKALIEQAKQVVGSEVEDAKREYRTAYEAGDAEALVAAQQKLTAATIKMDRINSFRPPVAQPQQNVVQTPPSTVETQVPKPDAKAIAWKDANPWFGSDREMTALAMAVHQKLVDQGVDTSSDDYYERINARMRQVFPDAFTSAKPSKTVVAPATRSTAPKKIVLTQTQVNLAKRLGLTNDQYAKAVAEEMRKQNG